MTTRLMAKSFDVERGEKGSKLQSKINQFTKGKNIAEVHDFSFVQEDGHDKGLLLYSVAEGDPNTRVLAKVVEGAALGTSELQTKVNSFSKGKEIAVNATAVGQASDGTAIVVVLYTKEGTGDEGASE